MPTQRRTSYIFALSGAGAVQQDFNTPMPDSAIDTAWSVTSDTLPNVERELARTLDCTNQDLILIELLRRVTKWSFDFQADPAMLAPAVAYVAGVAAAPTGSPRNQVQRITIVGTGGTFKLTLQVGTYTKETTPLPYNASASDIKRAVENLTAVGRNNSSVAAVGGGVFDVTIQGNLSSAELPVFGAVDSLTGTGHGVTVAEQQSATQRSHLIHRTNGYQPPPFSAIVGSNSSALAIRKWISLVADQLRIAGGRNTPRLTASLAVAGSAEPHYAAGGYVLPACQLFRAVRFLDCDLIIDGVSYQANNLWRSFELRAQNNLITDEDAQTAQDEDIHRAERADVRGFAIDATILGESGDDLYSAAEEMEEVPVSLRVGRSGNNITFALPKGVVSLRNPAIVFDGTARRSAIALTIEPELIPGDATTPWTATANVGQSATLLTPAT